MKLPVDYTKLDWRKGEVRAVREQYVFEQFGLCMFCGEPLNKDPHAEVMSKKINWELFPPNFRKHPVHLQHDHITGMTEGAVHMYCNAVLWQYEGKQMKWDDFKNLTWSEVFGFIVVIILAPTLLVLLSMLL